LGRVNIDGTVDTNFTPIVNERVCSVAVQPDGKILVGGYFTSLCGQTRNHIGRLKQDGTLDTAFDPGANDWVLTLVVQADGKILVGGYFSTLGGQDCTSLGRLNADGTIDAGFYPGTQSQVNSLALQADGKILIGGIATVIGETRYNLGRLNTDGTLDVAFNPGADGMVNSLAIQADGKILAGGSFSTLGGQPRSYLGRLNSTIPATQSLICDGSSATWLRGGSSPEVWRTTFDYSANGTTWTNLGAGTRIPGGWQITGLSLPPSGTVRARGHTVGGIHNGSAWFVESNITAPWPICLRPMVRDHSNIVLSWAGGQGPYQVQQTTNVAATNSWQNVGTAIQTNSATIPLGTGRLFLRVRGQ
jgi:uncharacterized delta-60 repeat protein